MTPRWLGGATPAVLAVLLVAGTGMAAVVATALGAFPLYGAPTPGLDGWRALGPDLAGALRETLTIAVSSTLIAAIAGLFVAQVILSEARSSRIVGALAAAVLAVPHLVGAASVGLLLANGGMAARVGGVDPGGWPRLVAGPWPIATVLELAWKESAFVALVVVAALGPGHRRRLETASVLGAGPWQRWSRVLLPTSLPATGAASLIVFVYIVGSYEVAALLGRTTPEPLPVLAFRLFGSIELTDRPAAAAAATTGALLALVAAVAVLATIPSLRTAVAPRAVGRPGSRSGSRASLQKAQSVSRSIGP